MEMRHCCSLHHGKQGSQYAPLLRTENVSEGAESDRNTDNLSITAEHGQPENRKQQAWKGPARTTESLGIWQGLAGARLRVNLKWLCTSDTRSKPTRCRGPATADEHCRCKYHQQRGIPPTNRFPSQGCLARSAPLHSESHAEVLACSVGRLRAQSWIQSRRRQH